MCSFYYLKPDLIIKGVLVTIQRKFPEIKFITSWVFGNHETVLKELTVGNTEHRNVPKTSNMGKETEQSHTKSRFNHVFD